MRPVWAFAEKVAPGKHGIHCWGMKTALLRALRGATTIIAMMFAMTGLAEDSAKIGARQALFIGNSFTYGGGSGVHYYRADTVTDLNGGGKGGVPALFKAFTIQAGQNFDVSHELIGGSGIETHLEKKSDVVARPWDFVVMHGYSTLDKANPGDPTTLITAAKKMAKLLHQQNSEVEIWLEATWSRADQTYLENGNWYGEDIFQMAKDVRRGYDQATASSRHIRGVISVGEAWNRAMASGVADSNPYDGISYGQMDLWTHDHYHGGTAGYYLSALMVFGELTGLDPRSLGRRERSASEIGLSRDQAAALQAVAFDELTVQGTAVAAFENVSSH